MRRTVCLVIVVATLAMACGGDGECNSVDPGHVRFGNGDVLTVRIADTSDERARGLMGVTSLPSDEGMAFIYEGQTEETFWMKDTMIPLAIAFVDADRIVAVREMPPCTTDACPTYDAQVPYTFAVEANSGWFRRHGITEGDIVRIDESHCQ